MEKVKCEICGIETSNYSTCDSCGEVYCIDHLEGKNVCPVCGEKHTEGNSSIDGLEIIGMQSISITGSLLSELLVFAWNNDTDALVDMIGRLEIKCRNDPYEN